MNYTIEEMITKAERALVRMRVALSFVESGVKPAAKYDITTLAIELEQCGSAIRSKVDHKNASTGLVGAGNAQSAAQFSNDQLRPSYYEGYDE